MRLPLGFSWPAADPDSQTPVARDFPTPREVLGEVGLLLALHLAVAFAVTLTLRLCGIG